MANSLRRHLLPKFLGLSAATLLVGVGATAQAQHATMYHPGGSHYGGVHAPHYPGVPYGATDVVVGMGETEPVIFYRRAGHYFCVHDGQTTLIRFGETSHAHDIAHELFVIMTLADEDMVANYRGNPGYQVTHREMHDIFMPCARKLDELTAVGDVRGAQAQLAHFVDDFDHFAADIRHWHRFGHRQIGRGGLLTKLDDVHSLILHLSNALGVNTVNHPVDEHHGHRSGYRPGHFVDPYGHHDHDRPGHYFDRHHRRFGP